MYADQVITGVYWHFQEPAVAVFIKALSVGTDPGASI
jgi:hypothetical protein